MPLRFPIYNRQKNSLINKRSQSALEYMMTYGWAILIIVIVAAVLYSFGIFSPSSSISATITGFSGLGSVDAVCLGGTSFTVSLGNSLGYPINITRINLTSSSSSSSNSPGVQIPPGESRIITVPGQSLCTAGSRYSVSAIIAYTEPGQTFPGPYLSRGTASGTANSPPSSITSYETLAVRDTQPSATPSPFQQMVNITSSDPGWSYISSSPFGQNVVFFSPTGQILDSWLENYTSTHAIWWVKLPNGAAPSDPLTIYMGFAPSSTNLFNTVNTGEAPQISSTYAEYDDGANVFNNYWNFAGTSSSGWTISGTGSVIVNNGLILNSNGQGPFLTSVTTLLDNSVIDGLMSQEAGAEIGIGSVNNYVYAIGMSGTEADGIGLTTSSGLVYGWVATGGFQSANTKYVMSGYYVSGGLNLLSNYISILTSTDSISGTTSVVISGYASGDLTSYIQWLRIRAYPPNGVMPTVNFGSVS